MLESTTSRRTVFRRAVYCSLICLAAMLAGCDKISSGSTDSEAQEGRDTVEAMSREHANDSTDPSEAAELEPTRSVDSETLAYADVNDELVYGYLAYPSGVTGPLPAIIMIHEWWGLNDNIRAMANRYAAEGYMVLAVDLYGGETATTVEQARLKMLHVVENPEPATENLRQALGFLEIAGAPAVASLGWCFGGGWSLNTAMLFPEQLDASVIYYGQVTADDEKLGAINAPLLGLFGANDRGIKVESVRRFEDALQRLGKDHTIHVYPDVGHAFANPTGNNYNAVAAEDAWQRTIEFLAEYLIQAEST
jgi:carboxymethylenebutenolidase